MLTRWMRFTRFSSPSETNGCRRVLPERHSANILPRGRALRAATHEWRSHLWILTEIA